MSIGARSIWPEHRGLSRPTPRQTGYRFPLHMDPIAKLIGRREGVSRIYITKQMGLLKVAPSHIKTEVHQGIEFVLRELDMQSHRTIDAGDCVTEIG